MKAREFNVTFVTPLLIDGANRPHPDSIGLTGKALRGCWRFWFRAIIGGIFEKIDNEELLLLESKIFGSADAKDSSGKKIGAKFRMNINAENEYPTTNIELGFNSNCKECKGDGCYKCNYTGKSKNKTKCQGFPENSSYTIKIIRRNTMSETELNVLFSTIWVWGNLGAVGKRERRGFGSPLIGLKNGDNPFTFYVNNKEIILPIKQKFVSRDDIEDHLQEGLSLVWDIYDQWISKNKIANGKKIFTDISKTSSPINSPYFILRSCGQVFVGNLSFRNRTDAIANFHGNSSCDGLGWAKKKNRMASPLFIRFHKIQKKDHENFIPVISWCQQQNVKDPHNCALAYLKRKINGTEVFSNNLKGDTL